MGKRVVSLLSIIPRGKRPSLDKAKIQIQDPKIQFQRNVKEGMNRTRSDLALFDPGSIGSGNPSFALNGHVVVWSGCFSLNTSNCYFNEYLFPFLLSYVLVSGMVRCSSGEVA